MDLFGVFAEPKTGEKLEYLPDELEDAFQATQIVTTPMQPNLEEEQITAGSRRSGYYLTPHTTQPQFQFEPPSPPT